MKEFETDVRTVEQLIADVKRIGISIDAIIQDRGTASRNNLMRPSGLIYYEAIVTSLFDIPDRAIICFNHSDLEVTLVKISLKRYSIASKTG